LSVKHSSANPQFNMRLSNQSAILLELLQQQQISRSRLAEQIGVSPTTITNIINELIEQGIVEEAPQTETSSTKAKVGRPRTALQLIDNSRYAIGIYIRTGLLDVGITNLQGSILHQFEMSFEPRENPETIFQQVIDLIHEQLRGQKISLKKVLGIGVGAQGQVDSLSGINLFAPNLRWRNLSLINLLEQFTALPICVDNNIRLMALGEARFGGHDNINNLAFVHVEGGVGAGLVVEGNIYAGANATAGEIGHTTILPENGELCTCGNHGCLETLISEDALIHSAHHIARAKQDHELLACLDDGSLDPLDCIFDKARDGDHDLLRMLQQRARYMGIALANLINLFNPATILLGGRIYAKGTDILLPVTVQTMTERSFAELGERTDIQIIPPEAKPGLVGAAGLVLDRYFYRQDLTV